MHNTSEHPTAVTITYLDRAIIAVIIAIGAAVKCHHLIWLAFWRVSSHRARPRRHAFTGVPRCKVDYSALTEARRHRGPLQRGRHERGAPALRRHAKRA